MMRAERGPAFQEWAKAWPVALGGLIGYAVSSIQLTSIGVLMKPIVQATGWTRTEVAFSISISSVAGIVAAPIVGAIIDRASARAVASIGLPLYCLTLAAAGLTGPAIWTWYLVWIVNACGCFAGGILVWTQGVASRFDTQRGLALAVCLSGYALAQAIVPPLAAFAVDHYNWRLTYFALGLGGLVVGFLTTRWLFVDARSLRAAGQAGSGSNEGGADQLSAEPQGNTLLEALRSTVFWRLAISIFAMGTAGGFMVVHAQAYLTDHGISIARAATFATIAGPCVIVGRLSGGYLLDRMHGRLVAFVNLGFMAASAVCLLAFTGQESLAIWTYIFHGLGTGAQVNVMAYLVTRYFGFRRFGAIFGALIGVAGLGAAIGPLAGGLVYDRLHSYGPMLAVLAGALSLSALLMLTLRAYPRQDR